MNSSDADVRTIGILGAGRVGTAVARQALATGYDVTIATAKPVEEIAMLVDIVTPGVVATDAAEVTTADLVVIAVPLHKHRTVDPQLLAGRTVVDVMNYWAPTDGRIDAFEDDPRTSSEVIQDFLAGADVVKTLNHIGYHELESDGRPAGDADRRALALAGDSEAAKARVAGFLDRMGYDPVDAGELAAGRAFQPGTQIFNGTHTADQLRGLLREAAVPATV